jgi:hypothetical protein
MLLHAIWINGLSNLNSLMLLFDELLPVANLFNALGYSVDIQGCTYVVSSFMEYSIKGGRVIQLLVEAIGECL